MHVKACCHVLPSGEINCMKTVIFPLPSISQLLHCGKPLYINRIIAGYS